MQALRIQTGADPRRQPLDLLDQHFGKAGSYFHAIARGTDDRAVRPNRERKSIGSENTLARDRTAFEDTRAELQPLIDQVWGWCERTGVRGCRVTLKVKYADFRQITRARSSTDGISDRGALERASLDLHLSLLPVDQGQRPARRNPVRAQYRVRR